MTYPKKHCGFQLTHPTRGATSVPRVWRNSWAVFQLTHPTRGATRRLYSIQEPCEFQLTHPTRGATNPFRRQHRLYRISTHTPHTGCDDNPAAETETKQDFNSHTPHGVRHSIRVRLSEFHTFQLTHPTRGATYPRQIPINPIAISTHTPHTGCDYQRA